MGDSTSVVNEHQHLPEHGSSEGPVDLMSDEEAEDGAPAEEPDQVQPVDSHPDFCGPRSELDIIADSLGLPDIPDKEEDTLGDHGPPATQPSPEDIPESDRLYTPEDKKLPYEGPLPLGKPKLSEQEKTKEWLEMQISILQREQKRMTFI